MRKFYLNYCAVFCVKIEKIKLTFWINVSVLIRLRLHEPPHDKTNRMTVHPAKTQISLGICPVWSESSLCTLRIAKDPSFFHADSPGWSESSLSTYTILLVLSWGGSHRCRIVFYIADERIYFYKYSQITVQKKPSVLLWVLCVMVVMRSVYMHHISPFKPLLP